MLRAAFTVRALNHTRNAMRVVWGDGVESTYPNVYLRASVRDSTFFDGSSFMYYPNHVPFVGKDVPIASVTHQPNKAESVKVEWEDHHSTFDASWLRAQDVINSKHLSLSPVEPTPWDSGLEGGVREYDFSKREEEFESWMKDLKRWGIIRMNGCPPNKQGLQQVLQMVGPLRRRFSPINTYEFRRVSGVDSEETRKAVSSDRAYGTEYLPAHTDATEFAIPGPLEGFLYCDYQSPGIGKDTFSIFMDSFKILQVLKQNDPESFDILSSIPTVHSRRRLTVAESYDPADVQMYQYDLVVREPIISLDEDGNIKRFRFRLNKHVGDMYMPSSFYRAYQKLQGLLADKTFHQLIVPQPGSLILFNNHRVCHGRHKIFPGTSRHLMVGFVEDESFDSRWRFLLGRWTGLSDKWLFGCTEDSLNILTRRLEKE